MKSLFLPIFVASQLAVFAQQHQINWGTSSVTDRIITSDGSAITLAEFSIELGGFAGGFVPTQQNFSQWVENWQVFDAVTAPDSDTNGPGGSSADGLVVDSGDPTSARFAGTGFLQVDNTSSSEDAALDNQGNPIDTFGPSQQAYVFIRNQDTAGVGAEWLLYTSESGNDWEFPSVVGGQPDTPDNFFLSEVDSVLFGEANVTNGDGTTNFAGGGISSDQSTDFILRTNTFVPEPSSALLILLGSFSLLRRRR